MDTTNELDARLAALRAEIEGLRRECNEVRAAALDDPDMYGQLPALQTRLNAYPAQVGELTRRRVLAHLAELRAAAAAARPEYDRLDALDTERAAALATWRKDPRSRVPAALDAYWRDGRAIDAQYKGVAVAYELKMQALRGCYHKAAQLYGVGLDGSDEERAANRQYPSPLPYSQAAWEAVANKIGQDAARRAIA